MATLAALTPAQMFTLAANAGDSGGRIGSWTLDSVTAYATNAPAGMGHCAMAFEEAKELIAGAGLDYTNLTTLQFANANLGMAYSVAYKLLLNVATGQSGLPAENFTTASQEFGQRVKALFDLAGKYYDELGITPTANPYFNSNRYYASFEQVSPQNATPNYPFNDPQPWLRP